MEANGRQKVTVCHLCKGGKSEILGRILTNEGLPVHVLCMVFCSGVSVRPSTIETMFALNSNGAVICNKNYRPGTMRFGIFAERSRTCYSCNNPLATFHCSVPGCDKSVHMPCALSEKEKGRSFIFHSKMVHHPTEESASGGTLGVVRSDRFLICSNHQEWEDSLTWKCLKNYISVSSELLNAISIDVDALPVNIQIAVSITSQLAIFNPSSNKGECKYSVTCFD